MADQFEQKLPVNFGDLSFPLSEKMPEIKIWGEVTDPKEHDPKKFRYLVHAFKPSAIHNQVIIAASAQELGAYKADKLDGDQSINLFYQPERLGERVSLSMSLIDQRHTATWGQGGIIVEAPEGNIAIISPTDAGWHNSSKEPLRRQAQDQSRLSGEQLLQSTSDKSCNEVVAFAKSATGKTVNLKGFFIKVDKNGQPTDSVTTEKMRQHAIRLNLPLVEIQAQGPYEQEKFEIAENSIWAHYRGNRYNLGNKNPDSAFNAYDDKVNTFFPSPDEIEEVVAHFRKRGDINEEKAQQILERYRIADAERKNPKIEYDPKTSEVSRVTIRDGYGKDAIQYWLNPSGYCYQVNMGEYKKALTETPLNLGKPRSYEYPKYQTPLSSSQVFTILETRKETMKPEEYKKLYSFLSGIKDKIDQVYNQ